MPRSPKRGRHPVQVHVGRQNVRSFALNTRTPVRSRSARTPLVHVAARTPGVHVAPDPRPVHVNAAPMPAFFPSLRGAHRKARDEAVSPPRASPHLATRLSRDMQRPPKPIRSLGAGASAGALRVLGFWPRYMVHPGPRATTRASPSRGRNSDGRERRPLRNVPRLPEAQRLVARFAYVWCGL